MRAVPCALVFGHGQRSCRADLRPRLPGCRLAADARLAPGLAPRAVPARDRRAALEALQARAVADPAWFWGAAADDLGLDWQRRPSECGRERRPGVGALVERRRLQLRASGDRAEGHARPGWRSARLGGRGRRGPAADQRRAPGRGRGGRRRCSAAHGVRPGDRVGIFLPMLPETVIAVLALGRIGAIYTPIFSGYGAPAVAARLADCEAERARHRRRLPPPRRVGAAEGGRRRGRGARAVGPPGPRRPPCGRCRRRRRGTRSATAGGTSEPARAPSRRHRRAGLARPTPRRPTCSSTRRARPAGRRAPSTSTAASRSRPPRTSPTLRPARRATRCSGSPTSAG